ncbi:MAG: PEP-CTERM sorting domain-containing protein [Bryobacteraceae bacterium]|nr:PEP-CTERM sorting domain-containing protein [Bryobacteraceae bacterium]
MKKILLVLTTLAIASGTLAAAPIDFQGTGVVVNAGQDQRWGILDPNAASVSTFVTQLSSNSFPFLNPGNGQPLWVANNANSSWVSPNTSYETSSATADAAGTWVFFQFFDLSNFLPSTTQIVFRIAADNAVGRVLLNNVDITSIVNGQLAGGLAAVDFFALSGAITLNSSNATFLPGANLLYFEIQNFVGGGSNPVGFRLEVQSADADPAGPIPEPATYAMMGGGLLLLALRRRLAR